MVGGSIGKPFYIYSICVYYCLCITVCTGSVVGPLGGSPYKNLSNCSNDKNGYGGVGRGGMLGLFILAAFPDHYGTQCGGLNALCILLKNIHCPWL